MADILQSMLGPGGALRQAMGDEYESRPGQVDMARAVHDVLLRGGALLAEAGTGVGKTMAYLIPALLSGRKVVISTGTKNLQEQIMGKDIPMASRLFPHPFKAAMMKGRSNYVCKRRLLNFAQRPLFATAEEAGLFQALLDWANETSTGDRAELAILPDSYPAWGEVCSKPELCLGAACRYREDCHVTRMRARAAEADLVVVNHHLFFADLALREDSYGEVIPRHDAVIFDEAHLVEDVATSYFGQTLSSYKITEAARDAERELRSAGLFDKDSERILSAMPERADRFFAAIRGGRDDKRRITKGEAARWVDGAQRLSDSLNMVADYLASIKKAPDTVRALSIRFSEIAQALLEYVALSNEENVYWMEPRGRGVFLHSTPIDVSAHLKEKMYPKTQGVVFTSATLAAGEDFSFIQNRLGLDESARALAIPSPFDYQRQAVLYVPDDLPEPAEPEFIPKAAERIKKLLQLSRGRAFLLFTSHSALEKCWGLIHRDLPYSALKQGSAPRDALLQKFREDVHSVLFGASSFWQGVDVKGEALFAVIIDKLPFATPDDPVVAARIERIRKNGGSPFMEYQVPSAALSLKQGLGRLIRSREDRGFLAVLDKRLFTKSYGKTFLAALPPFALLRSMDKLSEAAGRLDYPSSPNREGR